MRVGDVIVYDDRMLPIRGLERFKETLREVAVPSGPIGVLLGENEMVPPAGTTVRVEQGRNNTVPSEPGGQEPLVPDQALLVGYSGHKRSLTHKFGVLMLEGPRVRLVGRDEEPLIDAPGSALTADKVSSTRVALAWPDGLVFYLVGPSPAWARRGRGAALVERYRAGTTPDFALADPGKLPRALTPAIATLALEKVWVPILLRMLLS